MFDDGDDNEDSEELGEAERYNDEHIAPKLLELAEECHAHGLTLCAQVTWGPHEASQTTAHGDCRTNASHAIAYAAALCSGHLDAFIMTLLRWHDEGSTDISRTMLAVWAKRGEFAESATRPPEPQAEE